MNVDYMNVAPVLYSVAQVHVQGKYTWQCHEPPLLSNMYNETYLTNVNRNLSTSLCWYTWQLILVQPFFYLEHVTLGRK